MSVLALALHVLLATAAASRGVSRSAAGDGDELLRLGMCTALTGPAADLGLDMKLGFDIAFDEANRAGGVHGRRLALVALDDGFEPEHTMPQMRKLVFEERVLAVVGNVGTSTAIVALPIATGSGTPFFAAFSGAGVLRKDPPDRLVFNYRASLAEETAAMVDALLDHGALRCEEIAIFTQRDAFGDAGCAGAVQAMKRHGLEDERSIAHLRYERNSVAVESAVADYVLLEPEPRAVIMVGTYAPCAAFIRECRAQGSTATFSCVSSVGAQSLARELGAAGEGVFVTQVVPHCDSDLPVVREYRAALSARDASAAPGVGSLEGYVAARVLLRALEHVEGTPTRASLADALETLGRFDLGLGVPLNLSAAEHQACHRVWLSVIHGGRVLASDFRDLGVAR
jgi:ABC-type branched-subunit amino acid transport system substrate-binding protein